MGTCGRGAGRGAPARAVMATLIVSPQCSAWALLRGAEWRHRTGQRASRLGDMRSVPRWHPRSDRDRSTRPHLAVSGRPWRPLHSLDEARLGIPPLFLPLRFLRRDDGKEKERATR